MESICALIFTLILVFPLVIQLQMLILDPKKLCTIFHYYATNTDDNANGTSSPKLLQHYPKQPIVFNAKSDSKILLTNLRTVSSSPVLLPQLPSIEKETAKRASKSLLVEAKHSFTFVKTDEVLPVVDITWNYNSYRYKAFEACLRNRYGDKYPPGEVVLNSMQLNLLDSHTNVDPTVAGLFDFVKDSEPAVNAGWSRKLEIEYLNPLDHFVTKQPVDKPSTEERYTETLREQTRDKDQWRSSHNAASTRQHPIGTVITDREKNARQNQRFLGKIEPCKCNLSLPRRVHGTNDFPSGGK